MSAVIGVILAVLAVYVLIKVAAFVLKLIAVLVLIGLAIGAWVVIKRKIDGGRR
jgi:hypothetical protein